MSSAILYVAIVAIWACVLIPRWLRRDPARGAGAAAHSAVPGDLVAGDLVDGGVDGGAADEDSAVTAGAGASADGATGHADAEAGDVPQPAGGGGAPPSTPGEARQRMLAARRRLLGILAVLEVAAMALAASRLAALWVLIPPTVMFAAYLLLLREAARGDAERAQREAEAARARARAHARATARAPRRVATTPAPVPATVAPAQARAARYEDMGPGGRDFAPGLAGKYTTSNAAVLDMYEPTGEDLRDQYRMEKLRAVGD